MASTTDIRQWLKEKGRDVPERGRLKQEDIDAYEAAHGDPGDLEDGGDDLAEAAGPDEDARGPETPSAVREERPRPTRRTGSSSLAGGLLGRGRGRSKAGGSRAKKERRTFPRVPVNKLIEHMWSDMAWAASGLPPLQRMLEAQAPLAGMTLEDIVKDTAIDKALQPAARIEDRLDKAYGLIMPNVYVLAIMATAPAPKEAPSVAHKASWVGLRHSLLAMARNSKGSLKEVEKRGRENKEAERDVEEFMAYLFDMPAPPPPDDARMAQARADAHDPRDDIRAAAGIGSPVVAAAG